MEITLSQMDKAAIEQKKREITQKFGQWTNHNIRLPGDVYTIGEKITGAEVKLKRYLQLIADLAAKPFDQLRILDLACLEGLYSIELALQGAKVVGIEGREANIEKAKFARDALSLNNLEFIQDDVRNLSVEKYGYFDVVLCSGILYHLDVPDVFNLVEKVAEVCQRVAIVDTHVTQVAEKCYVYKDQEYWGSSYVEHDEDSSLAERQKLLWASLDNTTSFWLTRPSFYNLLSSSGFTSVYECHNPPVIKYEILRLTKAADRNTFIAIKGRKFNLLSSNIINEDLSGKWPEKYQLEVETVGE